MSLQLKITITIGDDTLIESDINNEKKWKYIPFIAGPKNVLGEIGKIFLKHWGILEEARKREA